MAVTAGIVATFHVLTHPSWTVARAARILASHLIPFCYHTSIINETYYYYYYYHFISFIIIFYYYCYYYNYYCYYYCFALKHVVLVLRPNCFTPF
jgi:hypothetical protein